MNLNDMLMHIHKRELPERIQVAIDKYGFSIYKGVLVVWGSSVDKKLLNAVDQILEKEHDNLLVVHLEDNLLDCVWKSVPDGLAFGAIDTSEGRVEMKSHPYLIPVIF